MVLPKKIKNWVAELLSQKQQTKPQKPSRIVEDDEDEKGGATTTHDSDLIAQWLHNLGANGSSPYTDERFYDEVRRAVADKHDHWNNIVEQMNESATADRRVVRSVVVGQDLDEPMPAAVINSAAVAASVVSTDPNSVIAVENDLDVSQDSDVSGVKKR